MNERTMSIGISLFEPLDDLVRSLFYICDHYDEAKKKLPKMQIARGLDRICVKNSLQLSLLDLNLRNFGCSRFEL